MIKLFLSLCIFFCSAFSFAAAPVTIQTVNLGGKFIPIAGTGALTLEVATGLARAAPWITAVTTGYQLLKMAEEAGLFSVRPSDVTAAEYSGGASSPPSTASANGMIFWPGNNSGFSATLSTLPSKMCLYSQSLNSTRTPTTCTAGVGSCANMTSANINADCFGTGEQRYSDGVVQNFAYMNIRVKSVSCPPGYTASGSNCNLTNPSIAQYPSDGKYTYVVDGPSLSLVPDPLDPDFALGNVALPNVPVGSFTVTSASNGLPVQEIITPQADGGLEVLTRAQELVNGETRTYQQTFVTNNNGAVTSYSASTYQGPITSTNTTAVITNSTSSPITFPSDYSRQGEAQTAADSIVSAINPKLDTLHDDLSVTSDQVDPTVPDVSQFDDSFFNGTFSNLLGWSLPGHTSQCPTSSFSFNSVTYTFDSHCQLIQDHFSVISAVMTVVWSIAALFVILAA